MRNHHVVCLALLALPLVAGTTLSSQAPSCKNVDMTSHAQLVATGWIYSSKTGNLDGGYASGNSWTVSTALGLVQGTFTSNSITYVGFGGATSKNASISFSGNKAVVTVNIRYGNGIPLAGTVTFVKP